MQKSYYEARAVIRYYGPPGFAPRWPDAPHVAFANLQLGDSSLRMFTKQYGPLYLPKRSRPEEPFIPSEDPFFKALTVSRLVYDLGRAQKMQELLRQSWRGERWAIVELEHDLRIQGLNPWFGVTEQVLKCNDAPAPRDALTLVAGDIWVLVRCAFLMDYKIGRIKVCRNAGCVTPYFVESRKGQKFCCHKCAVLINVRRFRKRQAKGEGTKNGNRARKWEPSAKRLRVDTRRKPHL